MARDTRWDALQRRFKAACRARNALCHFCIDRGDIEHAEIDYSAPRFAPNAFEADHIKSWDAYPYLRYEWNNLAASHSRCNRQARDKREVAEQHDVWVKPDW